MPLTLITCVFLGVFVVACALSILGIVACTIQCIGHCRTIWRHHRNL